MRGIRFLEEKKAILVMFICKTHEMMKEKSTAVEKKAFYYGFWKQRFPDDFKEKGQPLKMNRRGKLVWYWDERPEATKVWNEILKESLKEAEELGLDQRSAKEYRKGFLLDWESRHIPDELFQLGKEKHLALLRGRDLYNCSGFRIEKRDSEGKFKLSTKPYNCLGGYGYDLSLADLEEYVRKYQMAE